MLQFESHIKPYLELIERLTMTAAPAQKTRSFRKQVAAKLGATPEQIDRQLRVFSRSTKLLASNYSRFLDDNPNEWIAIYDGKLRATAKSHDALLSKLKKQGLPANETLVRFIDASGQKLIL
jgi:hypothetical protein